MILGVLRYRLIGVPRWGSPDHQDETKYGTLVVWGYTLFTLLPIHGRGTDFQGLAKSEVQNERFETLKWWFEDPKEVIYT